MVAVDVVERSVHEVVEVVAVRHPRVAAAGVVPNRAFDRSAGRGPAPVHLEDVLGDARVRRRVEMPVVEIIGVIAMTYGLVTAARPVLVGMSFPVLQGSSPSLGRRICPAKVRGQAGTVTA